MIRFTLFVVSLIWLVSAIPNVKAQVLFEIDGRPVTAGEFKYVYKKNSFNNPDAFTKKDLENYLQLYINFKLKIRAAHAYGYDTLSSLKSEYESYRSQIRKPYLNDENLQESLTRQAYDRLFEEVRASHLLIRVAPDAPPADTLKAYERIVSLRERILSGEPFEGLAAQYSEDPSAAQNRGDLGYFSSMQMVWPFEDAAYRTPVGETSLPVRTQFGYHLIKVHDKRKSAGKVKVAHIMLRFPRNMTQSDSALLRDKIFDIHNQLTKGFEWSEACRLFSEDPSTKENGGEIRPFGKGVMPPEFSDMSFSLETPGQISDPFTTAFGWHIVKLIEKIGIEPYDELKDLIAARVSNDGRSALQRTAMINRIKKENGYKLLVEDLNSIQESPGNPTSIPKGIAIAQIGDKKLYTDQYLDKLSDQPSPRPNLRDWLDEQVMAYEDSLLPFKYPEFRYLSNEYWEGILLFHVMEQKVWNKAVEDSTGLESFYQKNLSKYTWKSRMAGWILETASRDIVETVQKWAEAGNVNPDTLEMNLGKEFGKGYRLQRGPFEKGNYGSWDDEKWEKGVHTYEKAGQFRLVYFEEVLPSAPKELSSIKGLVISDYQDEIDKLWIKQLRGKYKVKINKKTKNDVFRELTSK